MNENLRPTILPTDLIQHIWMEVQKQHLRHSRRHDLTLKRPSLKEPRGIVDRPTSSDDDEESQYEPQGCGAISTSESESMEDELITIRKSNNNNEVIHERGMFLFY